MSNKFFKKIRKEARKETAERLGEGIDILRTMIKPKPKYCPKFIWILFYIPLFKKSAVKYIYKNL